MPKEFAATTGSYGARRRATGWRGAGNKIKIKEEKGSSINEQGRTRRTRKEGRAVGDTHTQDIQPT